MIAVDPQQPAAAWRTVIPQGRDAIEFAGRSVTLVGHRLLVRSLHDAHSRVVSYALDGSGAREIELPGAGTAVGFDGEADDPETYYAFSDLVTPPTVYRYDVAGGRSSVWRAPRVAFDPAAFQQQQVFYPAKDGTRIPLLLAFRRGLNLHANNPVLLYGYGGFGLSSLPAFNPARIAWLEMGGVFALANIRGGGEYGEAWHRQAIRTHKQVVFDDFLAAARFLIDHHYTSAPRLAIHGRSNGGLLVGACLTQRPDLFGAAVAQVGVLDMLRFNRFGQGAGWEGDYGSPQDPQRVPRAVRLLAGAQRARGRALPGDAGDHRRPRHARDAHALVQVHRRAAGGAGRSGADPAGGRPRLGPRRRRDRDAGDRAERGHLRVPGTQPAPARRGWARAVALQATFQLCYKPAPGRRGSKLSRGLQARERTMNTNTRPTPARTLLLAVCTAAAVWSLARADEEREARRLEVTSMTFTDGAMLPLSAVDNITANNLNVCTADGSAGGNESPQLSWRHAPHNTRSFVVIAYDTTAAFSHWGMYNIAARTTSLPQNAGAASSSFGRQVNNDFGDFGYEGPCPPTGVEPFAHHYVFTVYALDTELSLPASANFPANAETLLHALLAAGRGGHILASGSITGLFSSTPAQ